MIRTLIRSIRPRRTITPRYLFARKQPVFLASYPKSGRTWLRFILANYLARAFGLIPKVDLQSVFGIIPNDSAESLRGLPGYRFAEEPDVPLFICTHRDYDGPYFGRGDVVFLIRSPYDVLVSLYFHVSRQEDRYGGQLTDFLRDPEQGVLRHVEYLNAWVAHLDSHRHLVVSYEQMNSDARSVAERVLDFAGLAVDQDALAGAVADSAFDRMQEVELHTGIAGHVYDARDPDALRVRRGVVGGYTDYLSAADVQYVRAVYRRHVSAKAAELLHAYHLTP